MENNVEIAKDGIIVYKYLNVSDSYLFLHLFLFLTIALDEVPRHKFVCKGKVPLKIKII